MVGQLNKIMMHYGCSTGEGLKIQVSLELLTLEMEISSQPLQESYKRYGHWITAEKLIFFLSQWKCAMSFFSNEDTVTCG